MMERIAAMAGEDVLVEAGAAETMIDIRDAAVPLRHGHLRALGEQEVVQRLVTVRREGSERQKMIEERAEEIGMTQATNHHSPAGRGSVSQTASPRLFHVRRAPMPKWHPKPEDELKDTLDEVMAELEKEVRDQPIVRLDNWRQRRATGRAWPAAVSAMIMGKSTTQRSEIFTNPNMLVQIYIFGFVMGMRFEERRAATMATHHRGMTMASTQEGLHLS